MTGILDSDNSSVGLDEAPFPDASQFLTFDNRPYTEQFSQEIRLEGQTDKVTWVGGLYYLDLEAGRDETFSGNAGLPGSFLDAIVGIPQPTVFVTDSTASVSTESFAVFGEAVFHVNDWSNLTLGARWTQDDKTGRTVKTGNQPSPFLRFDQVPGFDVTFGETWEEVTPRVIYDMTFDDIGAFDNIFLYATAARGFKAGGWNTPDNAAAAQISFDPELSWNYEIGVKTGFWGDRARLNATVFQVDTEDLQVTQIRTINGFPTEFIDNAGEARVRGIELEANLLFNEYFRMNASYAYNDSEYTEFVDQDGNDFSGNRLPQTPENTYNVDFDFSIPAGDGEFFILANVSFRDDVTFNPDAAREEAAFFDNTSFHNYNLSLGYETGPWRFSAWGKNLTDERALNFVIGAINTLYLTPPEFFSGEDYYTGGVGNPRTYGVTVSRSWGE